MFLAGVSEIILMLIMPILVKSPLLTCFLFNVSLQTFANFNRQMEMLNQDDIQVLPPEPEAADE